MKIKEIDATANMAWSPAAAVPIMLAAGTSAQQLDATFSTTSTLEIYELNLGDAGMEMPKISSMPVENRYHKLVWGDAGMANGDRPKGVIVGGLDRGFISVYDVDRLIKGQEGHVIFSKDKHTGPVTALDFNPFQSNLLASGASESEIFIWDLNRLQTPMTPGAKTQPVDDVRCVAWNRQVQHILASTSASRCVVWDLRKNEPIIKVSDSTSRMRCKVVAWNPDVATQLCIASEDDHTPVIQIWDLRLATSPLRTLERHQRGILSLAWCKQDSDLLLSCGKDNSILCWNPNSNIQGGEVQCELATSSQWSFEVSWCPRNPGVLASSSFDGKISVYSVMGGQQKQVQSTQMPSAIADSFPGMESLQMPVQSTFQTSTQAAESIVQLKKPPKWLRRPCGANFGFGGKLVSFISEPVAAQQQQQQPQPGESGHASSIFVSNVVTEPDLVERSRRLETSLETQNVSEFCQLKLTEASSEADRQVWNFIEANFSSDPRIRFLSLIGYEPNAVAKQIALKTGKRRSVSPVSSNGDDNARITDDFDLPSGMSKLTTSNGHHLDDFEAIAARAEEEAERTKPFNICVDDSGPGMLSRALLTGNLTLAVDLCLEQNRMADALVLAMQGGPELLQETQKKYFNKSSGSDESHLIRAVVCSDWRSIIEFCEVDSWREALAAALTHAATEELPSLAAFLGQRLLAQGEGQMGQEAMLCFIVAGNLDKVVECWMDTRDTKSGPKALQDLVEVVMSLKFAVEQNQGFPVEISTGPLSDRLSLYASLLASQGALAAASTYLPNQTSDESIVALRERVAGALSISQVKAAAAVTQRGRGQTLAKQNSYSREPLSSRPSWGQTAYNNQAAPAPTGPPASLFNPAAQPVAAPVQPMTFSPQSQFSSYQHGIHNPLVEDLNAFKPPVQHFDQGITQRRNSRPGGGSSSFAPGGYQQVDAQRRISGDGMSSSAAGPVNIFNPATAQAATPVSHFGAAQQVYGRNRTMSQSSHYSATDGQHLGGAGEPASSYVPPTSSGPGWNDPPPMALITAKPKVKPVPIMSSAPVADPIMQPLYGAPAVPAPPFNDPMGGQMSYQQPGMFQPSMPQQQQPMPGTFMPQQPAYGQNTYNPPQVGGYVGMAPQQPAAPAPAAKMVTPEPPKPKGPIPAENVVIQEVFDGLRGRCLEAANHPQIRRKLDDVGRKLEILYDKLRDHALPPTTTAGLHEIVQYIWAYDYNSCQAVIHRLISGGSFDILAEFMPGVKVLIQVAMQLGAYVERPR